MERKKILIIGMFDSIHLARWLKQFEDKCVDFTLLPSKKYRHINPELNKLIKSNKLANYYLVWPYKFNILSGYIDFALHKIGNILKIDFRKNISRNLLMKSNFDYVHALEIQGAGYLYSELPKDIIDRNRLILTNWGSDIYFFAKDEKHNEKISKIVSMASYYSAECERDYELLKNYNFNGEKLPCIPNGGGFSKEEINSYKTLASKRNLILCKGYGGTFGEAQLVIPAIDDVLSKHKSITAFFYSVTVDIEKSVLLLKDKYGNRVNYSTVSNPLSRKNLLALFSEARVYIGCSKSDAISTSFLEALTYGAYPIQTNTSCANEWIIKGAFATLVGLDAAEINKELELVIKDDKLVNLAQTSNLIVAKKYLDENEIKKIAMKFYSL
jgi:hypothetical protein